MQGSGGHPSSSGQGSPSPEQARVARLATVGEDGRPHVVPICFVLDGDTLYTAVDEKPKRTRELRRLANIRANPWVEVVIDQYEEDWTRLWWVRLRGRAEIVEDERALALLAEKYEQYRDARPRGPVIAVAIEQRMEWRAAGPTSSS
jgi:PPOX class probable F420-dependent enzyme